MIPLRSLMDSWASSDLDAFLDSFSCSRDSDLETFLKTKAVVFEKMDRSRTYLFLDEGRIAGYVSLSTTVLDLSRCTKLSNKLINKLHLSNGVTAAFLIGQLGKADHIEDKLGVKMIDFAKSLFDKTRSISGGRIICVDCKEQLVHYYESLNFRVINKDEETDLYRLIWIF